MQSIAKQTGQDDAPETSQSDSECIDLIANLLLDFLDEEQGQSIGEG